MASLIGAERMFLISVTSLLGFGRRVDFGSQFVRGWEVLCFVDVANDTLKHRFDHVPFRGQLIGC